MAWGIWVLTMFVVVFNIYVGTAVMQLKEEIHAMRRALGLGGKDGKDGTNGTNGTNPTDKEPNWGGYLRDKKVKEKEDLPKPRVRRVKPPASDDEFE